MKSSNNNKQKKMEKSDQMYNKMDMHYYNEIYISQYSETKVEEKKHQQPMFLIWALTFHSSPVAFIGTVTRGPVQAFFEWHSTLYI